MHIRSVGTEPSGPSELNIVRITVPANPHTHLEEVSSNRLVLEADVTAIPSPLLKRETHERARERTEVGHDRNIREPVGSWRELYGALPSSGGLQSSEHHGDESVDPAHDEVSQVHTHEQTVEPHRGARPAGRGRNVPANE
jgi:hypothetical protein